MRKFLILILYFGKKIKKKKRQKLKLSKNAISTYYSIYKQGNYILKINPENLNIIIENENNTL